MNATDAILLAALAWCLWAFFIAWVRRPKPREGGTVAEAMLGSALVTLARTYSRRFHRMRIEGQEHIPARTYMEDHDRGILLVANHTAGVDPVLLLGALPFEPRWVMAEDMRIPQLEWLFEFGRIIFVDRAGAGSGPVREIVRHLKAGEVVGLFPEGHIERPAGQILPFRDGVGLFVKRAKPLVLPVVISGTPDAPTAWGSLVRRGRVRVRFLPVMDYDASGMGASEITQDLRRVFLEATGWPANDVPPEAPAPSPPEVGEGG